MIETVAEGLVLAEKSGLGNKNLQKFIEAIFPGPYTLYSQRMITGDYYNRDEVRIVDTFDQRRDHADICRLDQPVVSIDMARHLAAEVLALASASGSKLDAYEAGCRHMEMVRSHAGAKGDISGIYGAIRQESGLAYENQI